MKMLSTAILAVVSGLIVASSAIGFPGPHRMREDGVERAAQEVQIMQKMPARPIADLAAEAEAQELDPLGVPPLVIDPHHTWKGREARFQELLVSRLNQAAFLPEMRKTYFRWVEAYGARVVSWSARAIEVTPTADGVVIKLGVGANHTGATTRVDDVVYETYLLTEGEPILLDFQVDPRPKVTTTN